MAANVETMMYNLRNGLPWHGLGTAVAGTVDSEEALVKAGLAWGVSKQAIYLADGTEISDSKAVVRSTDSSVLGVVGNRYTPVQNVEAFRWVDALLGEGVTYETAGSLQGGKRVWMLAKLPEPYRIIDDEFEPYLCFFNSHDGLSAVKVIMTPIRVVCQNTLSMALRGARRTWSAPHVGSIHRRMEQARETLGLAHTYMQRLQDEGQRLARVRIDFERALEQLIPIQGNEGDIAKRNKDRVRQDLRRRHESDDLGNIRHTAWGFLQAVAEHVTHAEPQRKSKTWAERRWERILDGDPMMNRAHEIALATIN